MAHAETAQHVEEEYTSTGLNHRKLLMWVFLSSDCLFFGALIATYMVYRGQSLVGPYPIDIIDIPVTTISTFVLLCSSFAMVRALAATNANNQKGIQIWLLLTALMGAIFIGFQNRMPLSGICCRTIAERKALASIEKGTFTL